VGKYELCGRPSSRKRRDMNLNPVEIESHHSIAMKVIRRTSTAVPPLLA
jgi:hypothetical protein